MTEFKPFRCAECGRKVTEARPRSDVLRDMGDGLRLPLPDSIPIPSCECGEHYISGKLAQQIDEALMPLVLRARRAAIGRVIDHILRASGLTQGQLEGICAVSPGYLSKARHGERNTSAMRQRLLEALASCPAEVQRHIKRRSWTEEHAFVPFLRQTASPLRTEFTFTTLVATIHMREQAKMEWAQQPRTCANDNGEEPDLQVVG